MITKPDKLLNVIDLTLLTQESKQETPRRLLKYILCWCRSGSTQLVVDGNEFLLKKSQAITITSGQYHQLKKINGELYVLSFTLDFFSNSDNDIELIFHNGLFCHFGMNEVITVTDPAAFAKLLLQIGKELQEKPYQFMISVHAHIELLLTALNRSKIARGDEIWKPDALFLKFLEAVRNNFSEQHTIMYFARSLGTTATKLNELSKRHTNKTAQNVIYSLLISEAKRLLIYHSFTVKEIGYRLGFSDPFYFSNFFKKHAGLSPKDFKKNIAP